MVRVDIKNIYKNPTTGRGSEPLTPVSRCGPQRRPYDGVFVSLRDLTSPYQ